jgi:hypothetical protein
MTQPAAPVRWRSHAFGLAVEGPFAILGWPAGDVPSGLPAVCLELDAEGRLDRLLAEGGKTIARRRAPTGGWEPDVIQHPTAGYLLDEQAFGLYGVSERGRYVSCAVPRLARWRWQRNLVGRVLPFVSTLRGLEPWHASAVAIDGRAVALAGQSGVGKSTLAAQLMLGGAELLADDVLAIRYSGGEIRAYPGPGLVSLRRRTVEQLSRSELRRLGRRVGADSASVRLAVSRHERPLSLSALYLLEPAAELTHPRLTTLEAPDPQSLLRCAFNLALTTPARLVRQLDVCAMVAQSVRVVHVAIPERAEPGTLARHIAADLEANPAGMG